MKDMVLKNMIIRKCYFLLGIIMAANMFVVNEMKAMNKGKKLTENNTSQVFKITYGKEQFIYNENSSNNKNKKNLKIKIIKANKTEEEKNKKKVREKEERNNIEGIKEGGKRKGSFEKKEKSKNFFEKLFNINKTQNDIDDNHYTVLKTMRWCCFSAKPVGSLLWSFANSFYHFEKIELNKVYFFKYILCVGYRWQPGFMKKSGLFLDVNISAVSVIYSIICTIIKYKIDRKNIDSSWKWILAKSPYIITNSFNLNLNIKFLDKYFAINFSGFIAELLSKVVSPNAGLKKEETIFLKKN